MSLPVSNSANGTPSGYPQGSQLQGTGNLEGRSVRALSIASKTIPYEEPIGSKAIVIGLLAAFFLAAYDLHSE